MLRCGHIMGEADITLKEDVYAEKWKQLLACLAAPLAALWGLIVWTVTLFRRVRPAADWLLVPYLLWVSFTAYLNAGIWLLN